MLDSDHLIFIDLLFSPGLACIQGKYATENRVNGFASQYTSLRKGQSPCQTTRTLVWDSLVWEHLLAKLDSALPLKSLSIYGLRSLKGIL